MEAFPHMSTIDYFVDNDAEKFPQSQVLDFHNKADGHERRLATYLVENLRMATDLEVSFILCCLEKYSDDILRRTSTLHK
jgi:beta-mannosidase